jgi:dTDP-4-amino-4,6-dideoxygalactose transaminase
LKVWEWTCSILGDLEQDVASSVAGIHAHRSHILLSRRTVLMRLRPGFESEKAQDSGIILPLFSQMTEQQQERVAGALRAACVAKVKPAD